MDASIEDVSPECAVATVDEAAVEFQYFDKRSIQVNRISWLIFTLMVAGVFGVAGLIVWAAVDEYPWISMLVLGVGAGLTLLSLWMTVVWPRWEYERARWCLDGSGLQIHRGVIWRHQISVPHARMQHADVSQGPLQRRFGLGTLTVHTAGTQNASVVVEGLSHDTALELRDRLLEQRRPGNVV